MHDTTGLANRKPDWGVTGAPRDAALHRRFPTIAYLRDGARRHIPYFAYEYSDGGAGTDTGIARNWNALDAVELVPRYGVTTVLPPIDIELFGRRYAAPVGIAPMGGPALVWPGADVYLAHAAQRARIPYTLGTVGTATIERIAEIAPDVFWFQLYRLARNDHALGFDLVKRAEAAGAHVLMLTLDVPVRTTRPREVASGVTTPFRPDLRMVLSMLMSPGWLMSMWKHGHPRFVNLRPMSAKTPASTRSPPSPAMRWAAPSPGRRSSAIASAGSVRWSSRAFCIRPMQRRRFRSGSTASWSPTTAAVRSMPCRRRSTVCPPLPRRLANARPF